MRRVLPADIVGIVAGMQSMAARRLGMMGGSLMIARFVVLRSLTVMPGGLFVVVRCLLVMMHG